MRLRTKREKEVRQKQNENSRLATHVNELEKTLRYAHPYTEQEVAAVMEASIQTLLAKHA